MSSQMLPRKSDYTHKWIKNEDMLKIEDHIDDLIPSSFTHEKIYNKVKSGEIDMKQFKNLCIYFFSNQIIVR